MPAVGSPCFVSGAHGDVASDQHRSYSWRKVIGYTDDKQFVCLQTESCWPTVERLTSCWFAEIPVPGPHPASDHIVERMNATNAFESAAAANLWLAQGIREIGRLQRENAELRQDLTDARNGWEAAASAHEPPAAPKQSKAVVNEVLHQLDNRAAWLPNGERGERLCEEAAALIRRLQSTPTPRAEADAVTRDQLAVLQLLERAREELLHTCDTRSECLACDIDITLRPVSRPQGQSAG